MSVRRRWPLACAAVLPVAGAGLVLALPAGAATSGKQLTITAGETHVVAHTIDLSSLTIDKGGVLSAPQGDVLTLTVDGVEKGQKLQTSASTTTVFAPGHYGGTVVLTVSKANEVTWQKLTFPLRQALYIDHGVKRGESVTAAVSGSFGATHASDLSISSTGEVFGGVYDAGGSYSLVDPMISLRGSGRSDFIGDGAAITASGTKTRLVVNGARIDNAGADRSAIVATNGAHLIVENSKITTADGPLPPQYEPTVDLGYMMQVPWMLSIAGDNRATNLLGDNTEATYINSSVSSQDWGALSTDSGSDGKLTAIDDHVSNRGSSGYGTYVIGNASEQLLGDTFDVASYGSIQTGGSVHYGNSTHAAVRALNKSLGLGLSTKQIAALPVRATVINSKRFGVMWHAAGTISVDGGTQFNTKEATFLDKGQQIGVSVNGSGGVKLNPANGVILQMMDNDDPGPNMASAVTGRTCPCTLNNNTYTVPTGEPTADSSFDTTTAHSTDAQATFTDIKLSGDFYNGIRGGDTSGGPGALAGLNMVLTFDGSRLDGVISSTLASHHVGAISAANYQQLGEVSNAVQPAINNGVIVTLTGDSTWTVSGTSYLSKLEIDAGSALKAPAGKTLTMTVNGTPTTPQAGQTYTGNIELSLS